MRVASCELKVTSYLQVESLKERVEIQKCEFKSTSSSSRVTSSNPGATSLTLLVASSNLRVLSSNSQFASLTWRVTGSNPRVTSSTLAATSLNPQVMSSNLRVQESFDQLKHM